jgi:hypothetical protein
MSHNWLPGWRPCHTNLLLFCSAAPTCLSYNILALTGQKTQFLLVVVQLLPWEHDCLLNCYSITALVHFLISRSVPSNGLHATVYFFLLQFGCLSIWSKLYEEYSNTIRHSNGMLHKRCFWNRFEQLSKFMRQSSHFVFNTKSWILQEHTCFQKEHALLSGEDHWRRYSLHRLPYCLSDT